MELEEEFFIIPEEIIFERKIYPYHIYIFNQVSNKYLPFLPSNTPFISEKVDFMKYIISKGAQVAIKQNQRRTFLKTHSLKKEDIPSLMEEEENQVEIQHLAQQENLKKEIEQDNTSFSDSLSECIQNDNYLPLIIKAQKRIMALSIRINPTTSMAIKLAEILMAKDTQYNRIVAISYFLAINCKITSDEEIGDLVTAAFLHHIGNTQLELSISHIPYFKLSDRQKKDYKNHGGLSDHLIKKANIQLTETCKKIILQHHERYNGLGYPEQTIGVFISPLSLILGAVSHIVEYADGKIVEQKRTIEMVIVMIQKMSTDIGLETSYGDLVFNSISSFLDKTNFSTDNKNNKKNNDAEKKLAA